MLGDFVKELLGVGRLQKNMTERRLIQPKLDRDMFAGIIRERSDCHPVQDVLRSRKR